MNQQQLRKKWFKNEIPYTQLEKVDKEELITLLWFLRGYFDYEIKKLKKDK